MGVAGWGGMNHSHEVVQYVVTKTLGDPSMTDTRFLKNAGVGYFC